MAWVALKVQGRTMRFATKRKAREYLLRAQSDRLEDSHTVQLHHGCSEYKVNGKTYTSGHKVATAEFRGF